MSETLEKKTQLRYQNLASAPEILIHFDSSKNEHLWEHSSLVLLRPKLLNKFYAKKEGSLRNYIAYQGYRANLNFNPRVWILQSVLNDVYFVAFH